MQFLNLVTTFSEQNKMTASNLAIVITPNVVRVQNMQTFESTSIPNNSDLGPLIKISRVQLWEPEAVHDPMDVGIGARLAAVVEMVIAQYQWLFQVIKHLNLVQTN